MGTGSSMAICSSNSSTVTQPAPPPQSLYCHHCRGVISSGPSAFLAGQGRFGLNGAGMAECPRCRGSFVEVLTEVERRRIQVASPLRQVRVAATNIMPGRRVTANDIVYTFFLFDTDVQRHMADLLRDSDLDAAISQSLDEAAASPQKPTAKSFLETIRRQDSQVANADLQKQVCCPVCDEKLSEHEAILRLPCQHVFHHECLMPWLGTHNTCPICRTELPAEAEDAEGDLKCHSATQSLSHWGRTRGNASAQVLLREAWSDPTTRPPRTQSQSLSERGSIGSSSEHELGSSSEHGSEARHVEYGSEARHMPWLGSSSEHGSSPRSFSLSQHSSQRVVTGMVAGRGDMPPMPLRPDMMDPRYPINHVRYFTHDGQDGGPSSTATARPHAHHPTPFRALAHRQQVLDDAEVEEERSERGGERGLEPTPHDTELNSLHPPPNTHHAEQNEAAPPPPALPLSCTDGSRWSEALPASEVLPAAHASEPPHPQSNQEQGCRRGGQEEEEAASDANARAVCISQEQEAEEQPASDAQKSNQELLDSTQIDGLLHDLQHKNDELLHEFLHDLLHDNQTVASRQVAPMASRQVAPMAQVPEPCQREKLGMDSLVESGVMLHKSQDESCVHKTCGSRTSSFSSKMDSIFSHPQSKDQDGEQVEEERSCSTCQDLSNTMNIIGGSRRESEASSSSPSLDIGGSSIGGSSTNTALPTTPPPSTTSSTYVEAASTSIKMPHAHDDVQLLKAQPSSHMDTHLLEQQQQGGEAG